MREVNFSIPNVNKASVGITTALYDRRALDCTSTLPLINSLNHLAYLTTSSARIRDILTVDGGIERLICILKQGRSQEMMEMWKWNLAFQCVVNIGVRGSEAVRTRVVEADIVPVIATLLDNYVKITDKWKEEKDAEARRGTSRVTNSKSNRSSRDGGHRANPVERGNITSNQRSARREAPPSSIEIPQSFHHNTMPRTTVDGPMEINSGPQIVPALGLPHERSGSVRHQNGHGHAHQRPHHHRSQNSRSSLGRDGSASVASILPMDVTDGFGPRAVRDTSVVPGLQNGFTSQPESPTTPNAPFSRPINILPRNRRRLSLRQQRSTSGDSDDGGNDQISEHSTASVVTGDEPMVDIQANVDIGESEGRDSILEAVATPLDLAAPAASDATELETFNISHRADLDSGLINTNINSTAGTNNTMVLRPPPPPLHVNNATSTNPQINHERFLLDRSAPPAILAATPRDEDILMSLQLLAYVSKYCNLRGYFQRSHLVPKLKIEQGFRLVEEKRPNLDLKSLEEPGQEEYLLSDDYNIFPLVEKFTVRHHSQDMQYWAGVVMRNLCRKDDSRGGIRQCAYYECGKWEEWTRQFAKCRRCRRTKYCSKDCQKNAWVYHRHWCQVANS